ncbi:GH92 family glycosyl hydrolase [Flavobacterium sp. DG1-102-2]|uniref:GH92 family glycosyl hydrolase n=1 Tax=Flavobacterium sp. DG1-102-2 TaxID=3081663 RepID=UPI00294A51EE|nr:GH92 family glycosyl hydrolase [Flavobacterium sp. DG1-102-2]MDV6169776.1 GH92 family glycosyl hydrolase [Flavobacterium sp. DG1-102-2]
MKKNLLSIISIGMTFCSLAQQRLIDNVNPFIGTGAAAGSPLSGNNYPGATTPFGMVQLSPDTRHAPDWSVACGYNYNDAAIAGFSHTHLSGTGVAELFDVMLMPFTGEVIKREDGQNHYESSFSHQEEKAHPGYYSVMLKDYNVNAELTATAHAGFHRYTFPKGKDAHIILDLEHSMKKSDWNTKIIASQITFIDDHTIEGYRIITGWAPMRKVYFSMQFSKPITHNSVTDGSNSYDNMRTVNGNAIWSVLDFDMHDGGELLVKVGLSATSMENAKMNLSSEIPDWDFDSILKAAETEWENELGKIKIEGTAEQKQIFYTALYHTFLQPNILSDVNGSYPASDHTIKTSVTPYYSTFSLWDTFRGAHPLYTILQPERTTFFVDSMLSYYNDFGYLPIWQLWGQENYCMIGNHAIPVIVDAILKGLPGINAEDAFDAVKQSSIREHPGSPFGIWEKYGYIPENLKSQSVSLTLELAYDDWCVAQLAKKLNKTEDYERFSRRSQFYRNLYDAQIGFFRAKDSTGKWIDPFDPLKYGANGGYPFTEGNGWQYFWYVPHDIAKLVTLVGGNKSFAKKLDTFFTLEDKPEEVNDNASGFIGQYAHGNEPSHHIAYLYSYAGQPWKTQQYTAEIMHSMYNTTSAGYAGNDDCGELSAWYIFSSLGFYPVNPANGIYVIGSPALKEAVIKLENNKTFTVTAKNASAENIYIQSARLNGKAYTKTYITHNDITAGGKLDFVMSNKPNKKWGTGKNDKPLK